MTVEITDTGSAVHVLLPAHLSAEDAAAMRSRLLEHGNRGGRNFYFQGSERFVIDTLFLGILATLMRRCHASISVSGLSSEALQTCKKARMDKLIHLVKP
ncbi:hypothetical protein ACFO4L_06240 [Bacillus daqingensis]|uniref:STAS domain-containing protein n=1 Tax=Bacillus daqingensis TaxID=872396 RepID=A0ABV9NVT8_9BACI